MKTKALTKTEQREIERISGNLASIGVKNPSALTELKIRLHIRRGYEKDFIKTAEHYERTDIPCHDSATAEKMRKCAREHGKEADRLEALIAKIENLQTALS